MTAALGTVPTLAERLATLERVVAEQAAVIAAHQARIVVLEDHLLQQEGEDGPAPAPLPPNWKPLKQAAALSGFSWSGLRKRIDMHREGPRWWRRRGHRILVDVTRMPRRQCDLTP
jgi:hypothetical protein